MCILIAKRHLQSRLKRAFSLAVVLHPISNLCVRAADFFFFLPRNFNYCEFVNLNHGFPNLFAGFSLGGIAAVMEGVRKEVRR
jgi:hypothetical protein